MSSTFDSLVADLTRDVHRVQPRDALQFCANWFQSRLEEQRTRTRDALAHRPSMTRDLPNDHYLDNPLSPTASGTGPTSPLTSTFVKQRSSLHNSMTNTSPFGTLNVPGNALLSDETTPQQKHHPSFKIGMGGDEESPSSPLDTVNPFASFAGSNFSVSNPGDYLYPPTSTILARRSSVSAESIAVDSTTDEPLPVFPKGTDQLRRIRASIANNFMFRDLDEEQETGVLNAMQEVKVAKDDVVILQGDVGEYFYVVEEGELHCFIRSDPPPPSFSPPPSGSTPEKFLMPGYHPEYGKKVAECKEGSSFGELALMYGHPRAATVVAVKPSTLWQLDRITFRTIILKAAHRRRTMYEHFLSTVPLLTHLGPEERSKIADALVSRVYNDGEAVVKQGEMGDTFFFVEDGNAIVTQRKAGDDTQSTGVEVGQLKKGEYFGELALLRLEPRAATVSAVVRTNPSSAKLKVAALDAHAFTRLLGPLREIMERNAGQAYGTRMGR
ncbi:protein kinase A regulatory subunit [Abortiporus biennis]|nr:protein kinase A regulatory subunit [Abortiporus biennis]